MSDPRLSAGRELTDVDVTAEYHDHLVKEFPQCQARMQIWSTRPKMVCVCAREECGRLRVLAGRLTENEHCALRLPICKPQPCV